MKDKYFIEKIKCIYNPSFTPVLGSWDRIGWIGLIWLRIWTWRALVNTVMNLWVP
jgi:hypothetical protein